MVRESCAPPNSSQKLTRPGFGPAAEPPRQLTRTGGGTPRASRRLTCGKRRAASASARGPWPCSLGSAVRRTNHSSRHVHLSIKLHILARLGSRARLGEPVSSFGRRERAKRTLKSELPARCVEGLVIAR